MGGKGGGKKMQFAAAKGASTLKGLCAKLQMAQKTGKVALLENEPWFKEAVGACGNLQNMGEASIADKLLAKKEQFSQQFHALTDDAMDKQCQQLEMAKEAGHEELMQGKAWYKHLEGMCSAMREHHPVVAMREAAELLHAGKDNLKKLDGTSVAMGCTSILQAQHNGKVEWFEKQKWYKKTLALCNSMHDESSEELKTTVQDAAAKSAAMLKEEPADLMREGCAKLQQMQESGKMNERKPLVHAATKMCSLVKGKSPEEIRHFVGAQEQQAESAGGLAMADTCKKLQGERGDGADGWTAHLSAMCAKMSHKKKPMDPEKLMKRCKFLRKMQDTGMVEFIKDKPWFPAFKQVCAKLAPKLDAMEKKSKKQHQSFQDDMFV